MGGRSVLLLVNRRKRDIAASVEEVKRIVSAHGAIAGELSADGEALSDARGAGLIMVLGGDGTLLAQARRCVGLGLPIVGVNLGTLGFLAEFDVASLRKHAGALVAGEFEVSERELIAATIEHASGERRSAIGLNDVVVTAGPPFRVIEIGIAIDGHSVPGIKGDGVIVSTAIGSTAYSVSSGGPIVSPDVRAMAITPIAAHSLAFRPIVVPSESVVELTLVRANRLEGCAGLRDARGDAIPTGTSLVVDGQELIQLAQGDVVRATRHAQAAKLVRNPDSNYWATLVRKMHWAVQPGAKR